MSSVARDGRRRRLLHEGSAGVAPPVEAANVGLRYAPAPDDAGFALAQAVLPAGWRGGLGLSFALAAALGVLGVLNSYGSTLATAAGSTPARAVELLLAERPASIAAWFGSSLWLGSAALSVMLLALRRQRMDDLRCAYRTWLVAAIAALLLSANAATHAHVAVAGAVARVVGFSPLSGDALWWLLPGGIALGALAVRMAVELAECRPALVLALGATGVSAFGWLVEAGASPTALSTIGGTSSASLVGPFAVLVGTALAVMAQVVYARRILLEARGDVLSPVAKTAVKEQVAAANSAALRVAEAAPESPAERVPTPRLVATQDDEGQSEDEESAEALRVSPRERRARAVEPDETQWVSGAEAGDLEEYEDDDSPRRVSKADRKRLRRQRERDAA
ncbi:MAG: hypothetical protein ACRCT8_14830 [Lacipirellulaceae bacterium]